MGGHIHSKGNALHNQTWVGEVFLSSNFMITTATPVLEQEGFLQCQTPTSSRRLKDKGWRIETEGGRFNASVGDTGNKPFS